MNATLTGVRIAAVLACCAVGPLARAESTASDTGMSAGREALLAAYEVMPRTQLEDLFLHCDARASREMLDAGDGIVCAMAWDTLLKNQFGGDVRAFLAWWWPRRLAPVEPAAVKRP